MKNAAAHRSVWFGRGIVAVLAAALGLAMPSAAAASTTTTISFDDLSPGAKVSTQYDAEGVDFANGIVSSNVYCYPVITLVASGLAHSGSQVADTSCANGEFPDSSIRGMLSNSAANVSVYAGFSPTEASPPASTAVTLTAYDIDGHVVTSSTVTVPAGQGTHTPISVSSSSPNIVAFDVTATQPSVSIDDLTFDNPGGVPADFTISPQSGFVRVVQGSGVGDVVAIQRLNGSSGGVTLSVSDAPAGVHASFSPNPATGSTATMTVSADPSAPLPAPGPFPSFTVTGTPANAGVGSVPRSSGVQVDVQPLFTTNYPGPVSVPPCSTLQIPITVTAAPGFTGTVTLSPAGVPADDQASFSPASLTAPGQTHSTLTLTSNTDLSGPAGNISVVATGGGVADSSSTFPVSRVPPSITSLTDLGGAPLRGGQTPQGVSPDQGTVVVVHGQGFCPGSTVDFGNGLATAKTTGPFADGIGPFGDETVMMTSVPSLATSGDVYVVPPGETVSSSDTAKAPFTVDSYRDVNGFSFNNSDQFQNRVGGYSFSDVSDVFGDAATHLSANPCWPFGDCSITTPIPNPFALLFLGIANAELQDGQCFGFSLASQRLLHGDQIYPAFPQQPGAGQESVWNLQGPDGPGGTPGASSTLAHFIHLMHLEQLSSQALNYWLLQAAANAAFGSQAATMDDVTEALNAHDHPLIELRNGTEGHVVVAYGVDQAKGSSIAGNGDRIIDVYNPNAEFTTGETGLDGVAHETALSTSEIVVQPNGHWEFQGFSPQWHGGPGSLVVVPYSVVPLKPTLPTSIAGVFDLLFGSARATQVTMPDGHTLLNADGSVNTSRATGIADATQFATLSGTPKPGPDIFLFGHAASYATTVHGTAAGKYHDALFSHGTAVSLTAAATAAVTDGITVPKNMDGLQFGQLHGTTSMTPRAAIVQLVVNGAQSSQRTATIATTVPAKGVAGVMFDASHNAVEVTAGGAPTSYTLTLSWTGPHGFPQTFVGPTVHLATGDHATVAPTDWASLQSTAVALRIAHRNGTTTTSTLRNRIRPSARYSVALRIAGSGRARRLTINARLSRFVPGSSVLMTWELFQGRTLAASQAISLTGRQVHRGLVTRAFRVNVAGAAHYTLRAGVELLSPTPTGTYLSQQITRRRSFRG